MTHLFRLSQVEPQHQTTGGSRLMATKSNFPLLKGMSFYKLALRPKAIREPHWHANADELGYCSQGKVLVSLYATGNAKATFLVNQGEAFFIPSGSLHDVETAGDSPAEVLLQFSHESPEDFALSATFGMFTDAVLGNTWNVPSSTFSSLKRPIDEAFITVQDKALEAQKEASYHSIYRYNLDGAAPLISTPGGQARVARHDVWPILKRQALYSLHLTKTGMREPHWHPETAEMGYVKNGTGRMSILSPSGAVDTYEMQPGDLYFIPKAYPHHIENLKDEPLDLMIFFDQGMPGDIGFTASIKSFSNDTLNSILKAPPNFAETLPTYFEDLFIVNKLNPLDP